MRRNKVLIEKGGRIVLKGTVGITKNYPLLLGGNID